MISFTASAVIYGLCALAVAVFFFLLPLRPPRQEQLDRIPRAKYPGLVLGAFALLWCIPNIRPLLSPGSFLDSMLYPLALLALILAGMYLDFLFARAFAGILILAGHYMLKELYGANIVFGSAFFALMLVLTASIGIVLAAKPFYLRDALRYALKNKWISMGSACYFVLLSVSALIAAFAPGAGK